MPTILVVDDDDDTRNAIEAVLSRSGYEVLKAASCDEAVEIASMLKVDLALIDMVMPFKGGLELVKQLREKLGINKLILCTGQIHLGTEAMRVTKELGVHSVVIKPIDSVKLIDTIGVALRVSDVN